MRRSSPWLENPFHHWWWWDSYLSVVNFPATWLMTRRLSVADDGRTKTTYLTVEQKKKKKHIVFYERYPGAPTFTHECGQPTRNVDEIFPPNGLKNHGFSTSVFPRLPFGKWRFPKMGDQTISFNSRMWSNFGSTSHGKNPMEKPPSAEQVSGRPRGCGFKDLGLAGIIVLTVPWGQKVLN